MRPSLGRWICPWIEKNLVFAEGDYYGKPFRLADFERDFVWRAYELNPDGTRRYRQAVLGLPKGNGKTELAAAIGCAEFAGPVVFDGWDEDGRPSKSRRRLSPDIPVAAGSLKQANTLFSAAKVMLTKGRLRDQVDPSQLEIHLRGRPGKLYRVAAEAGTNDGWRPTFVLADELHEWTCTCSNFDGQHLDSCKARVHEVLSNGRAKRKNAWELNISTAGWNLRSVLGQLYERGKRIEAGLEEEDGFLFVWYEATPAEGRDSIDFSDADEVRRALEEANPAAGDFLPLENLLAHAREKHEATVSRYHMNRWITSPHHWIHKEQWDSAADPQPLPPYGTEVTLGFDGGYSRDCTALLLATVADPVRLWVVSLYERPDDRDTDWVVDIRTVEQDIRDAFARWEVWKLGADPHRWARSLQDLEAEGYDIELWPTHSDVRFGPACAEFRHAILHRRVLHDGDERLGRHVTNAVLKPSARDPRIQKEHKDSSKRIDAAVGSVIVYDMARRALTEHRGSWTPVI